MNCRDALRLIFDGTPPVEHLAECPACTAIHESLTRLDEVLRAQPMVEPPAGLAERITASIVGERRVIAWEFWKVAAIVAVSIAGAFTYWTYAKPNVPAPNTAAVERGVKRNVDYWMTGGWYGRTR